MTEVPMGEEDRPLTLPCVNCKIPVAIDWQAGGSGPQGDEPAWEHWENGSWLCNPDDENSTVADPGPDWQNRIGGVSISED